MKTLEQWRKEERWQDEASWVRLRAQICMAEWMVKQHPDKKAWASALRKAEAAVANAKPQDTSSTLVSEVEETLMPLSAAAKKFQVHCVGHAHIDMNWMWGWPETVMTTLDSFRTVLALMEEFSDFKFSQSQASVYEIVRQFDPALFKIIAERIREGRWEVTASHWVENDMNMVSGEALVRHLLQTRAYMKRHFGLSPEDVPVCWAPDTFGHAATEPNYLVRGGVRWIYLHRPGYENQPVPEAFWWTGSDGSRVLAKNDQRRGYNGVIEPGTVFEGVRLMQENHGIPVSQFVYGVGDHGGGPTRRDLLMLAEMNAWPVFPALVFSTTRAFFEAFEPLAAELPVLAGELNTEMTGCYTTQALIKRDNRIGEGRMLDVETLVAWAGALDMTPPLPEDFAAKVDENWRRVLFSHFHDILPGSCVRDSRLYCHGQFQETMAFTTATTAQILRALAAQVATDGPCGEASSPPPRPALFAVDGFGSGAGIGTRDGILSAAHGHGRSPERPYVVFNTLATARSEEVEFKLWDRDLRETAESFRTTRFSAVDARGEPLRVQFIGSGVEWGHVFQRYVARLSVPPMGYTTVVFREDDASLNPADNGSFVKLATPPYHCSYMSRERIDVGFESDRLSVRFDAQTGRIVSMFDKAKQFEMVDPAIGIGLEHAVEHPGGHSAWSIYSARKVVVPTVVSLRGCMDGPNTATVEAVYRIERSTVKLVYRLDAGEAAVRVDFTAEWLERGSDEGGIPNLRFVVGTVLRDAMPVYEIPFGALARPLKNDQEEPALRWAMLEAASEPVSMLVCNDCKYGHAVDGGALRVNLIRSAYEPDRLPELGEHAASLLLSLVPRGTDRAAATAAGQAFNHPLLVVGTDRHAGTLPAEGSWASCTGEGVVLDCFKCAEDGDGFVARLHNVTDGERKAAIRFDSRLGRLSSASPVDLLERPMVSGKPGLRGNSVHLSVPPCSIASIRIRFQPRQGA